MICLTSISQLHFHGYTECYDPRATFSSPSVPGLNMAIGNVGETLARYTNSDTFLSRDGGFTWQGVHKDTHLLEFGDSGSVLVMMNDEELTDFILFNTDEGLPRRQYNFINERMRVPMNTSRRFILMREYPKRSGSVIVHIHFTTLTSRQCEFSS